MTISKNSPHPDCTCDLEQSFGIGDDKKFCGARPRWVVTDAECGGPNSLTNLRLAHRKCNGVRGNGNYSSQAVNEL